MGENKEGFLHKLFNTLFSVAVAALFFYGSLKFTCFQLNVGHDYPEWAFLGKKTIDYEENESGVAESLLWNAGLLMHFFLTHVVLASAGAKKVLNMNIKGLSLYRTLYNLQSTLAIYLIMAYWKPVFTEIVLWDLPANYVLPAAFLGLVL